MANLAHFNQINKQLPALHHFKVVRADQGLREEGKNKTPSGGAATHLFYLAQQPSFMVPQKYINQQNEQILILPTVGGNETV